MRDIPEDKESSRKAKVQGNHSGPREGEYRKISQGGKNNAPAGPRTPTDRGKGRGKKNQFRKLLGGRQKKVDSLWTGTDPQGPSTVTTTHERGTLETEKGTQYR